MVFIIKYKDEKEFKCQEQFQCHNAEICFELYPDIENTEFGRYMIDNDYQFDCNTFKEINAFPILYKDSYEITHPFYIKKDFKYEYTISGLHDCIGLCVVNNEGMICCHLITGMYMSDDKLEFLQEELKINEISRLMRYYHMTNNNSKLILYAKPDTIDSIASIASIKYTYDVVIDKIKNALMFKSSNLIDIERATKVYLNQAFKDEELFSSIEETSKKPSKNSRFRMKKLNIKPRRSSSKVKSKRNSRKRTSKKTRSKRNKIRR